MEKSFDQVEEDFTQDRITGDCEMGYADLHTRWKNVAGLAGFKSYFGIWFFNGVFLKDEQGILISAQDGKTKSLRQWRFYSIDDIEEKLISSLIFANPF